jgi:hypothetical protein
MKTLETVKLLLDPGTGLIATPDIQRAAGCDDSTAWRFPLGAMTTTVTASMGIFTLTEDHVKALIDHARAKTSAALAPLAA